MPHHREEDAPAGHEHSSRGRAGVALVAGVIGGILGAAAALLVSPWRGEEARSKLKERVGEMGSAVKGKASEIADRVKQSRSGKEE